MKKWACAILITMGGSIASADLNMCLKDLRALNASRAITTSSGGSSVSAGVEETYAPNQEMIISSYSDLAAPSGTKIILHKKSGSLELSEASLNCIGKPSDDVNAEVAAVIRYNMSSDTKLFGNGSAAGSRATEKQTRDIVKECGEVDSDAVKAAVNDLTRYKGYVGAASGDSAGGSSRR